VALAQLSPSSLALPRHDAVVRPRGNSNAGAITWLLLASVLAGIASLFYLTQTSEVATTGYSIQELNQEESTWKLRNEQLSLDVARARSLAAVETEATTRMLMTRPKTVVYLQPKSTQPPDRPSPASRGDARSAPALEKSLEASTTPAVAGAGVLDNVRSVFASLLTLKPRQGER
jgi:hypothetical protein